MSLVRDRIREGNGSIEIKTEKGKGSKFIVHLPIVHEEALKAANDKKTENAKKAEKAASTEQPAPEVPAVEAAPEATEKAEDPAAVTA
ncbi:MAG: hypothetical protein Ta2A_21570 [Treponemataceae bacterium]|nr:MAG: hypothetical protein Ta2A_21570 [Treponemataceae bacterium]